MAKGDSEENMEKVAWDWVPNERIGPIEFAKPISDFVELLDLRLEQNDAIPGHKSREYYAVPGADKSVHEEASLVESVITEDVFIYKGTNFIGMTESKMMELLGQEPSEIDEIDLADEEGGAPYRVFTFDDLGLQVWSLEDRVESVSCWRDEGEEEGSNAEA